MTPEQKHLDADSLLQRLVETPAGDRIRMRCGAADLRSVITDLLSLVKSQEAPITSLKDLHDSACLYVTHNGACDCVDGVVVNRAAVLMRSACVEKIRPILRDYELEFRRKTNSQTNIVDYVVMALESVTLQEQETKQS